MDANDALGRVKSELGRAWLHAPDRIADLTIANAEPAHVGEFEIRSVFVTREVEGIEEPLGRDPTAPSQPLNLWAINWPPENEGSIGSTKIDVRETYEVLGCPACSQAGETQCGVCRGSGKVADPKTNRPTRCNTCKGKGTIVCSRCAGRGKLLRFKRIIQRVKNTSTKTRLPDGARVPTGTASGTLEYSERTPALGSDRAIAVGEALRSKAPELEPLGWLPTLADQFATATPPSGMEDARTGWRTMHGRWYEGWKLQCVSKGKPIDYFVPDTGASVVGPRLRSPRKVAAVASIIAVAVIGTAVVSSWRTNVEREEREAQQEQVAQQRGALAAQRLGEKEAADRRVQKEEADRRAAEEKARSEKCLASLNSWTVDAERAEADLASKKLSVEPDRLPAVLDEVKACRGIGGLPRQQEFAALYARVEAASALLVPVGASVKNAQAAKGRLEEGRAAAKASNFIAAEAIYRQTHDTLVAIPAEHKAFIADDVAALTAQALRLAKSVGPRAERDRKRRDREETEAIALAAVCGEAPIPIEDGGSYIGLRYVIEQTAHDPGSVEVTTCTAAQLTKNQCWRTTCAVRGKNAFGARVLTEMTFSSSRSGWRQIK